MQTTILLPVYEDWAAVRTLIASLDKTFTACGRRVGILLVDDGSQTVAPVDMVPDELSAIDAVDLLVLRRNLGHQRAIAVGLAHLEASRNGDAILVMDADGEDAPEDAVRLVKEAEQSAGQRVIFAERAKRSEGVLFRLGWYSYRLLHRILTGERIRFGNFSVVPAVHLRRLVAAPELWNHYAAAVLATRIPYAGLPTTRAKRLDGQSRVGYVGLVVHGLRALSVFGETVGVRLLLITAFLTIVLLGLIATVLILRFFTCSITLPGWTAPVVGIFLVLLVQALLLGLVFVFVTLGTRSSSGFLPARDARYFVLEERRLWHLEESVPPPPPVHNTAAVKLP